MLVDTHVHVMSADTARYPLVAGAQPPQDYPADATVTTEQLLAAMDGAGVDRAVIVQAFTFYGFDNSFHADSAALHPDRLVSVCAVDPLSDDGPDQLSYWVHERGMQGIRFNTRLGGAWLEDARTVRLFQRIADLGIPVCVLGAQEFLPGLRSLALRFPAVPIALDHISAYATPEGLPLAALDTVLGLAALPNFYLKVSTVNLVPHGAGDDVRDDVLRRIIETFGVRRVMWGTNNPVSHDGTYGDMVEIGRRAFPWLSQDDRDWFMGETAVSLWPKLRG